jgi:hypothetical protein
MLVWVWMGDGRGVGSSNSRCPSLPMVWRHVDSGRNSTWGHETRCCCWHHGMKRQEKEQKKGTESRHKW